MTILYFIPRYDPALMGNHIHAEVIEAWRARGVDAEVITLTAGIDSIRTETHAGITVHRLPAGARPLTKAANLALGALLHYPYLAGAIGHLRRFLATRRYQLLHIETAFPLGLVAALTPNRPPLAVTLPGAEEPMAVTVWIDVKTNLPLKRVIAANEGTETITVTVTYTRIALDAKIDDKEFQLPK